MVGRDYIDCEAPLQVNSAILAACEHSPIDGQNVEQYCRALQIIVLVARLR